MRPAERRQHGILVASTLLGLLALGISGAPQAAAAGQSLPTAPAPCPGSISDDLCNIDHLIFIVQENRSFDHYFGRYPGANGIPTAPGGGFAKSTCNPFPTLDTTCMKPFHTTMDLNLGGPHGRAAVIVDVNGGKMNGFINGLNANASANKCFRNPLSHYCLRFAGPKGQPDVMSFRTRADLPNYYALADWGVLQDRLFESVDSYSLPSHLFILSGWSATCSGGPMTCSGTPFPAYNNFSWTPITYLLDEAGVSWHWYVGDDTVSCMAYPDCPPLDGDNITTTNWNVAPGFTTIQNQVNGLGEPGLQEIRTVSEFKASLVDDTLPSVSWVLPGAKYSEHPGKGSMRPGYWYVSDLMEKIGASPAWDSTAVFLFWDDWGGFYDHVKPLHIDSLGYGIRVPGLVVSPYAKPGYIDSQTLSPDAYLKFIEDRFLNGARLDPTTMSRPDSRINVREDEAALGDLTNDFDFTQAPRVAPVLPDQPA